MLFQRCLLSLCLLTLSALAGANGILPAPAASIRDALRDNQLDQAIKTSEAATKQTSDARVFLWAGRAYGRQALEANLFTQAKWAGRTRDAWEKAVELDPDLLDARFDLIQYYLQAPGFLGGGRDKADQQVAAIGQRDAGLGKLAQSLLAAADKDAARMETLQREAARLSPEHPRVLLALSGTLQRAEKWSESETLWRERLQATPDDALSRYQLARIAAIRGENLDEGLALIDAFIESGETPEDIGAEAASWRRGQLLEKLGRLDEARAAYEIGMQDPAIKRLAEADLKRLDAARG